MKGASRWNKFPRERKARGDNDTSPVENLQHLTSCQIIQCIIVQTDAYLRVNFGSYEINLENK